MELNREQIIKALECCTRGRKSKEDRPCLDCPYNECNIVGGTSERQVKGTCQGWLMKDALALINSQEQRIKELAEENERLKAYSENLKNANIHLSNNLFEEVELAKELAAAEKVRKLQERLKGRMKRVLLGECAVLAVTEADIKQILNESLEDK